MQTSAGEWGIIVAQIKAGGDAGKEQLYKVFRHGIRYYLCRQLGPQDLEDKVHDTFLIVNPEQEAMLGQKADQERIEPSFSQGSRHSRPVLPRRADTGENLPGYVANG